MHAGRLGPAPVRRHQSQVTPRGQQQRFAVRDGGAGSDEKNGSGGLCIVSPDAGGVARAKRFRNHCENMFRGQKGWTPAGLAIIVKHRYKANEVAAMDLVGDVKGRVCVLVDDMTDTCGTLLKAAAMLRDQGRRCTPALHGV